MQYIAIFAFCALVVSCPFSTAKSKTSQTHSNWLYSSILAFCPMSMLRVLSWLYSSILAFCSVSMLRVLWQFIQCPEQDATETLQLTIPSHAMLYLSALLYYLRQNLLQFLHTPNFQEDSPDFHFQVLGFCHQLALHHFYQSFAFLSYSAYNSWCLSSWFLLISSCGQLLHTLYTQVCTGL